MFGDGFDEFEQYRARSYSGGFSPKKRGRKKPPPQHFLVPFDPPVSVRLPVNSLGVDPSTRYHRKDNIEAQLLEVVFERKKSDQPWNLGDMRPRVGSVPSKHPTPSVQLVPPNPVSVDGYPLRKVRSFTIIGNRLVSEGELYVGESLSSAGQSPLNSDGAGLRSRGSSGSTTTEGSHLAESHHSNNGADGLHSTQERYKVIITGLKGVGKSTIVAQFLARTNLDADFDALNDTEETERQNCATVILDGEEATLELVDFSEDETEMLVTSDPVAAYVVVYSVEDRKSFEAAIDRLYDLREDDVTRQTTVILVANKVDLVRTRIVQTQEGKNIAKQYECKFIEISAAIAHQIDELFLGVIKQIRLISQRHSKRRSSAAARFASPSLASSRHGLMDVTQSPDEPKTHCASFHESGCCLIRARDNVLGRLLKGEKRTSKSCVNLYVL